MKWVYCVEEHKQMLAILSAESVQSVIANIILVLLVCLFNFMFVSRYIYIYIYSNLTVWVPSPFLLYHWFVFYLACTILTLRDTLIIFTILSTVVHNGELFGSTATLGELLRLLVWFNVILLLAGALYAWQMVSMGIFKLLKFGALYVIIVWILICQAF